MKAIDADKLKESIDEMFGNALHARLTKEIIDEQPEIGLEDKKIRGTWRKSIFGDDFYVCSACQSSWNRTFEYCPYCGTKMDFIESEKGYEKEAEA